MSIYNHINTGKTFKAKKNEFNITECEQLIAVPTIHICNKARRLRMSQEVVRPKIRSLETFCKAIGLVESYSNVFGYCSAISVTDFCEKVAAHITDTRNVMLTAWMLHLQGKDYSRYIDTTATHIDTTA